MSNRPLRQRLATPPKAPATQKQVTTKKQSPPPSSTPTSSHRQPSAIGPQLLLNPELSNSPNNEVRTLGTVFNPGLKRQLGQARANKKTARQISSVSSYQASSGNEIYVNGDNCNKIIAATDDHDQERWGVSSRCAWVKSDSEQFMDRVNRALREP